MFLIFINVENEQIFKLSFGLYILLNNFKNINVIYGFPKSLLVKNDWMSHDKFPRKFPSLYTVQFRRGEIIFIKLIVFYFINI